MNKVFTPKPGEVYHCAYRNEYRMYVKVYDNNETLMCINLNTGESYIHTPNNGKVDSVYEKFAFNICEVVTSNLPEDK